MSKTSDRAAQMDNIAHQIRNCHRCTGMNIPTITEAAPGYGNLHSPVVLVGQSLCQPCMASQVPFTGGSGRLLDEAFSLAGITKDQLFISNVVHCHPPGNRPSLPSEIENCSEFLHLELAVVRPILIIALGKDAQNAIEEWLGAAGIRWSANLDIATEEMPAFLFVHHPAYIRRQPTSQRSLYINQLKEALQWAFRFSNQNIRS